MKITVEVGIGALSAIFAPLFGKTQALSGKKTPLLDGETGRSAAAKAYIQDAWHVILRSVDRDAAADAFAAAD